MFSSRTRTCALIWTRCVMMRIRRQWQRQLRWEWRQQLPGLLPGNVIAPTFHLPHHLAARRALRYRRRPSLKAACFGSLCNERESNEVARVTRGRRYICTGTIFHLHSSSRQNFGGGESSMRRRKSSRARVPQP